MSNWNLAYELTCRLETYPSGELLLTDDPSDPGGVTYGGVRLVDWDHWWDLTGRPDRPSWPPSGPMHKTYCEEAYWIPSRAYELPPTPAAAYFQMYFNMDPHEAISCLQNAVGATPDGVFGPKTLAAIQTFAVSPLVMAILAAQRQCYDYTHPKDDPNRDGLLARADRVLKILAILQ